MAYRDVILATTGIVSYWKLDETSGTNLNDEQGTADLTLAGGYTLNQTALGDTTGKSILFNGSTGKATRGSAVLSAAASTSLEAWFKTTDLAVTRQPIVFAGTDPGNNGWGLIVNGWNGGGYDTDGSLYILVAGVAWVNTGLDVSVNTIYHIVLTLDSSRVPRVYLNGALSWTGSAITPNTPGNFLVGTDLSTVGWFKGQIDEVAAYTAQLSLATVSEHFNAGVAASGAAQHLLLLGAG